jgi:hypothetical protein
MIDKLNEIGFSWEAEYGSWFDSFYEKVVAYKEKHGTFKGITADKEIGLQVCGGKLYFIKVELIVTDFNRSCSLLFSPQMRYNSIQLNISRGNFTAVFICDQQLSIK